MDDYNVRNGRSYQYFKGEVLFPFGYGLSYTSYKYSAPKVNKTHFAGNDSICVTTKFPITGSMTEKKLFNVMYHHQNGKKRD